MNIQVKCKFCKPRTVLNEMVFSGYGMAHSKCSADYQAELRGGRKVRPQLKVGEVELIKSLLSARVTKQKDIARMFLTTPTTISEIKHGRKWKWVK